MHRLVAWLLDPGRPSWPPVVARLLLAALFIPTGIGKFANHDAYVERFERWGFGSGASEVAFLVGGVEVICGLALLAGVLARPAALALVGNMVGAIATAGRVDGGQDVWLPLVAIAVLAVVVAMGAGRWRVSYPRSIAGPRA